MAMLGASPRETYGASGEPGDEAQHLAARDRTEPVASLATKPGASPRETYGAKRRS
jgi:hypothetical protein